MEGATLIDDRGIQIRVLGPVEVTTKNGIAQLGGPKQRALLAMLAARAGRVVTTSDLIDGIWGEEPPNGVLSSIHTYVSHLRTTVDQPIERRGSGYLLGAETAQIDANVFEEALEKGRRDLVANPMAASDRLRRALALWRGGAYADVADFPGLIGEAQRLSELRLSAVETRIEADLTLGRHAVLIGELESLTTEYPLRESLRAKQMLALYRDGRQADALRAFHRTEEYLREELGIDPSTELQELESRILNHDYTLIHSREVVSEQVALLFTDIVHSTLLWESNPVVMQAALARHDELVQAAIESAAGTVIKGLGDGFIAAFAEPALAVRAAVEAQLALTNSDWSPLDFSVRMAVDTGEVERRGGDLFGSPMNRGSRLLNAAHGGQILLSNEVQKEISRDAGTQIKSLGEHRFKGLGAPIEVYQLLAGGLRVEFPAPQTASPAMELDRSFGDSIRGYELRERVGRGAFATVYRGFQPSIGREVAIKIVKPEFANHPAFVRRFESEARFVASLEHPHIVSVYDYWRDADGAYVVGPFLAGRSLADAVFATMSRDQVMKIASQVGSALSYAHRQGVLHRDIKPANVLLDSDGNAYLADFGIAARAVEEATGVMSESAGYRAPEDQRGEAVDLHSDIYSLAALIAHLLTGRQPGDFDFEGLDQQLRRALDLGLAPDPRRRPESVDQFLELLSAGAGDPPRARSADSYRNPYKGLAAFQQTDATDFFGRGKEIDRLVAMVVQHRLSAVIGPSGSGKSSLALAGLLPALHQGAAPQSETWVSVKAVPGGYPFDELATALSALSTESLSDLASELASEDGKGLLRVAKRIGIELDGDLVIVLDQFEELFTLVTSDKERNNFASTLVTAASDPLSRVRIVLTLRADFFHQVLSHPELGSVISLANLALAPLDSERIRLAIVEPARRSGLELEPGLADRIIADLADQPGSLPLLQFTLDRLATLASEGRISNAGYDALGGVKGALAERAETTYQTLNEKQQVAAQQIFTRLLTVSDEADDVRRRVRVTEVKSLGLPVSDVNEVLDTFGKERLLTFDIDPVTRGATVEVAHEALLREWPTLRTWVDSRRESLVLQRRFQSAIAEWEDSDRSPTNLLAGGKLSQYEEWAAGQDVTLTDAERAFIDGSVDRRTTEAAERRTRRRQIMVGFASAAIIALLLAAVAFVQRGQAEENASLAEARELILEAEKNVVIDPERSMLLALQAIDAFRSSGEEPPPSAQAVLRRGMAEDRVLGRVPGGRFVTVSGDGTLFATRGEGDTVVIRTVTTREVVLTLPLPQPNPAWALFHPSGDWLAVFIGGSNALRALDLRNPGGFFDIGPPDADPFQVFSFASFNLEGDLIVIPTGAGPASLEVWSFPEGELQYSLGRDLTTGGSFSDDGRLAFFEFPDGEQSFLHIVDAATGRELQVMPLDGLDLSLVPLFASFSPDGNRLAIADDESVAMIDLTTEEVIWDTDSLQRAHHPIWLQDDRLFVGGENLASILDAGTGDVIAQLAGQRGGTVSYAAVPGTDWVASGGANDEETVIFDLGPPLLADRVFRSEFPGVRFMRPVGDGSRLAVNDFLSTGVIEAETGKLIEGRQVGTTGPHLYISIPVTSANGLYTTGLDPLGGSRVWSNVDGSDLFSAEVGWQIRGISEDATLAVLVGLGATQGSDNVADPGSTRLVRTVEGIVVAELDVVEGQWWSAVFSPDGRYLATNTSGAIQIWDASTGAQLGSIEEYDVTGNSILWTPDGSGLIVGGYDGNIRIFDVGMILEGVSDREAIVRAITAHDTFMWLVDLKNGRILSVSIGEPAKVWDLETGTLVGEFGASDDIVAAAFHPTEPILYAALGADQIGIFTLDPDELMEIARSRLSRDLTEEECQLYLRRSCAEGS